MNATFWQDACMPSAHRIWNLETLGSRKGARNVGRRRRYVELSGVRGQTGVSRSSFTATNTSDHSTYLLFARRDEFECCDLPAVSLSLSSQLQLQDTHGGLELELELVISVFFFLHACV